MTGAVLYCSPVVVHAMKIYFNMMDWQTKAVNFALWLHHHYVIQWHEMGKIQIMRYMISPKQWQVAKQLMRINLDIMGQIRVCVINAVIIDVIWNIWIIHLRQSLRKMQLKVPSASWPFFFQPFNSTQNILTCGIQYALQTVWSVQINYESLLTLNFHKKGIIVRRIECIWICYLHTVDRYAAASMFMRINLSYKMQYILS